MMVYQIDFKEGFSASRIVDETRSAKYMSLSITGNSMKIEAKAENLPEILNNFRKYGKKLTDLLETRDEICKNTVKIYKN